MLRLPNMEKDVEAYVKNCLCANKTELKRRSKEGFVSPYRFQTNPKEYINGISGFQKVDGFQPIMKWHRQIPRKMYCSLSVCPFATGVDRRGKRKFAQENGKNMQLFITTWWISLEWKPGIPLQRLEKYSQKWLTKLITEKRGIGQKNRIFSKVARLSWNGCYFGERRYTMAIWR